jgi:hypothetical protein
MNEFSYRGLSMAQLDELIYTQRLQGYDGIIEENARLRQENTRLTRQHDRVEAQTIGQIIQSILDQGFSVSYTFDRWEGMAQNHRFMIWKYYDKEKIAANISVSDFELGQMIMVACLDIERVTKQIDEQITQRRIIENALDRRT